HFANLPTGDYLLGNEIWSGKPSQYTPYPTRYYPGTPDRARASMLHLGPGQEIANLKLSLAKPHHPRSIRVVVLWPDGSAPSRNLWQVFNGDELVKNIGGSIVAGQPAAMHDGTLEFSGYAERQYDLHARFWIDDLGGDVPHDLQRIARSERVHLGPGSAPATV